jgi:hypothetical protein
VGGILGELLLVGPGGLLDQSAGGGVFLPLAGGTMDPLATINFATPATGAGEQTPIHFAFRNSGTPATPAPQWKWHKVSTPNPVVTAPDDGVVLFGFNVTPNEGLEIPTLGNIYIAFESIFAPDAFTRSTEFRLGTLAPGGTVARQISAFHDWLADHRAVSFATDEMRMELPGGTQVFFLDENALSLLKVGAEYRAPDRLGSVTALIGFDSAITALVNIGNGTGSRVGMGGVPMLGQAGGNSVLFPGPAGGLLANTAGFDLMQLASGFFTPTQVGTNVNVASVSFFQMQYCRVGSLVTVSGRADVVPSSPATLTLCTLSLPIASAISGAADAGGGGGCPTEPAFVQGDAAGPGLMIVFTPVGVGTHAILFSASYRIR